MLNERVSMFFKKMAITFVFLTTVSAFAIGFQDVPKPGQTEKDFELALWEDGARKKMTSLLAADDEYLINNYLQQSLLARNVLSHKPMSEWGIRDIGIFLYKAKLNDVSIPVDKTMPFVGLLTEMKKVSEGNHHIISLAAYFYQRFMALKPLNDRNEEVVCILINTLLRKAGYLPVTGAVMPELEKVRTLGQKAIEERLCSSMIKTYRDITRIFHFYDCILNKRIVANSCRCDFCTQGGLEKACSDLLAGCENDVKNRAASAVQPEVKHDEKTPLVAAAGEVQ